MTKKTSQLSDYIKGIVDKKYRTRSEAAADLGIDESVLSRICSGKRPGVSESIVEKICDKLGLDKSEGVLKLFLTKHSKIKQFFLMPKKPITFRVIHSNPNDKLINPEKLSEAYVPVPVVANEAIDRCISLKYRASEHTLIPNNWVNKDHNVQCCKVNDSSMETSLPNGSLIAADFDDRALENGSIYLLKWKNKIVLKRLLVQSGYVLLYSDNTDQDKYPVEICTKKKANSLKDSPILGRVVWSMAKL